MSRSSQTRTRWINEWNAHPKPFVWTKTADQILNTLALTVSELMTRDTRTIATMQFEIFLSDNEDNK